MYQTLSSPFKDTIFLSLVAEEKELRRFSHVTGDRSQSGSADQVNISDYEEGRAEALGVLCSVFTSQQCAEPFLPIYLARFYHALTVGLQYNEAVSVIGIIYYIVLVYEGEGKGC